MNPIDRIQSYYEDFTKTEQEIAIYIINNPQDAARLSIMNIAMQTKSSKSALIRFSQKIGYKGFSEFRFDLSRFLVSSNSDDPVTLDESKDSITSIANVYSDYILQLKNTVQQSDLDRIAERIKKARRIKIFGIDRTGLSATQLRLRLSKIGYDAEAVGNEALISDLPDILTEQDLLIVFTIRNNHHIYDEAIFNTHEAGCPVICFTMIQNMPFKKFCDEYIVLPRISRERSFSFLDNQAIYFVFIEMLLDALAKESFVQDSRAD